MALTGARELRLVVNRGVELTSRLPEHAERALTAGVIPDARGHDTIPPGHARHLGQSSDRIGHEVDDELCEGCIERLVRERQVLGGRPSYVDTRVSRSGRDHERLGGVDGRHGSGSQARDELGRECAGTAAHIEHPLLAAHLGEVRQLRRKLKGVPAHEAVVRLRSNVETHGRNLRCRARSAAGDAGERFRAATYHRDTVAHDSPIDAYLATLPAVQREALQRLRTQVARLVPDAVETISYGMPAFKLHGHALLWYAGWKTHCSIYPLTEAFLHAHVDELKGYRRTKGSLHFSPEAPLPEALVEDLVRRRLGDLQAGGVMAAPV